MYLVYYQSTNGSFIPTLSPKSLEQIRKEFEGSVTPLVEVVNLDSNDIKRAVLTCLGAQMTTLHKDEIGLTVGISRVISYLFNELSTGESLFPDPLIEKLKKLDLEQLPKMW
jgi:hypothetical protein